MNKSFQYFLSDIKEAVTCVRRLSPHPNPLPMGEGIAGGGLHFSNVCMANPDARFFVRRRMILPLPTEEGRVEGKRRTPSPAITNLGMEQL